MDNDNDDTMPEHHHHSNEHFNIDFDPPYDNHNHGTLHHHHGPTDHDILIHDDDCTDNEYVTVHHDEYGHHDFYGPADHTHYTATRDPARDGVGQHLARKRGYRLGAFGRLEYLADAD